MLLYLACSANLGLLCMPYPGRQSEQFWSFIQKVAHPVSDRTQPCITSVKLMEMAGPPGHSPRFVSPRFVVKLRFVCRDNVVICVMMAAP